MLAMHNMHDKHILYIIDNISYEKKYLIRFRLNIDCINIMKG